MAATGAPKHGSQCRRPAGRVWTGIWALRIDWVGCIVATAFDGDPRYKHKCLIELSPPNASHTMAISQFQHTRVHWIVLRLIHCGQSLAVRLRWVLPGPGAFSMNFLWRAWQSLREPHRLKLKITD
jgi:hypothetical protein